MSHGYPFAVPSRSPYPSASLESLDTSNVCSSLTSDDETIIPRHRLIVKELWWFFLVRSKTLLKTNVLKDFQTCASMSTLQRLLGCGSMPLPSRENQTRSVHRLGYSRINARGHADLFRQGNLRKVAWKNREPKADAHNCTRLGKQTVAFTSSTGKSVGRIVSYDILPFCLSDHPLSVAEGPFACGVRVG